MGSIPPIMGMDEEPLYQLSTPNASQNTPSSQKITIDGKQIDPSRFQKEPDYYLRSMDWLLAKAKGSFNTYRYEFAERLYRQFFAYMRFYRPQSYPLKLNVYQAAFEYAWVREINGNRREAERFLNEQLVALLERTRQEEAPAPTPAPPVENPQLEEMLREMQEREELPTRRNLDIDPSPETLERLARAYAEAQEYETAQGIAAQLEIRQFREFMRAQQVSLTIQRQDPQHQNAAINPFLPFGFSHWGVPLAPQYPMNTREMRNLEAKTIRPQEGIVQVQAAIANSQNPQGRLRQRAVRQKKTGTTTGNPRRTKPSRPRSKPEITF